MEESLDRGRRTVTEPRLQPIRAQSLQEGLASSSTRQPRFRTWRSAGGPAEPRRSSIQVVKLRQAIFGAHIQVLSSNRDEIDDRCTHGRGPSSLDRLFFLQSSQVDHMSRFDRAYRNRDVFSDRACLQKSVFEFQYFGFGPGCFLQLSVVATCPTECDELFQDSLFFAQGGATCLKCSDVFCCKRRCNSENLYGPPLS